MCSGGAIYMFEDEDHYEREEDKKFYNTVDDKWDYYSGLPNPKAYESE